MFKRLVFSGVILGVFLGPLSADPAPLSRIAFGSCLNQDEPQPVWASVVSLRPGLFIFAGDTVYAGNGNPSLLRAAYERLNAKESFQNFRSTIPLIGTWDDHDYGSDDAGADFPSKGASQQAFLDFYQVPLESPRREQKGIYHAELYGPPGRRVQVILLDTRYFRSPIEKDLRKIFPPRPYLPNMQPAATLLGRRQWNWLREQLLVPADVRLIVSGIQVVASEHTEEKWANFPLERKNLFDLLRELRITNAVFLSGDRHFAEISREEIAPGRFVYDVTSSALNVSKRPDWDERNTRRVGPIFSGDNFGLIDIDWSGEAPRLDVQIRDEDGHIRLQQDIHGQ